MLPAQQHRRLHSTYLQVKVAEWAQRDWQARVGHVPHELWVLQAAYAVIDALHMQCTDGTPHILRTPLLPCNETWQMHMTGQCSGAVVRTDDSAGAVQ